MLNKLLQVLCLSRWDRRWELLGCRRHYGRSFSRYSPRYRTMSYGSGTVARSRIYRRMWGQLPGGRNRSCSVIPSYVPSFLTADCYLCTKRLTTVHRLWSYQSSAIMMEMRHKLVNPFALYLRHVSAFCSAEPDIIIENNRRDFWQISFFQTNDRKCIFLPM